MTLADDVRELTRQYMAGGPGSFDAFGDLAQKLLGCTVLADNQFVTLGRYTSNNLGTYPAGTTHVRLLGGPGGLPTRAVRLRNGNWLRIGMTLYLQEIDDGTSRLKVWQSDYQYQLTEDGVGTEVFRYDYLRHSPVGIPGAHLNVYGVGVDGSLGPKEELSRVHFPTDRVSLESVIRLLIKDYGCETKVPREEWEPMLATSEQTFKEIAHRPGGSGQSPAAD